MLSWRIWDRNLPTACWCVLVETCPEASASLYFQGAFAMLSEHQLCDIREDPEVECTVCWGGRRQRRWTWAGPDALCRSNWNKRWAIRAPNTSATPFLSAGGKIRNDPKHLATCLTIADKCYSLPSFKESNLNWSTTTITFSSATTNTLWLNYWKLKCKKRSFDL